MNESNVSQHHGSQCREKQAGRADPALQHGPRLPQHVQQAVEARPAPADLHAPALKRHRLPERPSDQEAGWEYGCECVRCLTREGEERTVIMQKIREIMKIASKNSVVG